MVGGMFATPQSDGAIVSYDFIDQLYANNGVADAIDIVGIHPYSPDVEGVIEQLDGTREAIDDAGRRRLDLDHRDGLVLRSRRAGGSGEDAGAAGRPAAQELLEDGGEPGRMGARQPRSGSRWRDSEGPVGECQWCEFAGLVDTDRDTKPAWEAFTDLAGGTP